jgi:hypothetical protein
MKNPNAPAVKRERRRIGAGERDLRRLVGIIAAAVIATMFVLPADARTKKPKRPAAVQTQQASPSLDGRTLAACALADSTIFNMTGWERLTVPTAIDARVTVGDAT